jgi:ABC-type glycerol-3-phosphate transport system permease component
MRRPRTWPVHLALTLVSAAMLVPFYWVIKTSITGENIFAYPPSLVPRRSSSAFDMRASM